MDSSQQRAEALNQVAVAGRHADQRRICRRCRAQRNADARGRKDGKRAAARISRSRTAGRATPHCSRHASVSAATRRRGAGTRARRAASCAAAAWRRTASPSPIAAWTCARARCAAHVADPSCPSVGQCARARSRRACEIPLEARDRGRQRRIRVAQRLFRRFDAAAQDQGLRQPAPRDSPRAAGSARQRGAQDAAPPRSAALARAAPARIRSSRAETRRVRRSTVWARWNAAKAASKAGRDRDEARRARSPPRPRLPCGAARRPARHRIASALVPPGRAGRGPPAPAPLRRRAPGARCPRTAACATGVTRGRTTYSGAVSWTQEQPWRERRPNSTALRSPRLDVRRPPRWRSGSSARVGPHSGSR